MVAFDKDRLFERVKDHLREYGLPEEIDAHVSDGPVVCASFDIRMPSGRARRVGLEIDLSRHWIQIPPIRRVGACAANAGDEDAISRAVTAVISRWSSQWSPAMLPAALVLALFVDVTCEVASAGSSADT